MLLDGLRQRDDADSSVRSSRSRTELFQWGLAVAGTIVIGVVYASFIAWATKHARQSGLNGWDGIFLAMPPTQFAFAVGGAIAAGIAGKQDTARVWCATFLVLFALLDCAVWAYYDVGSCVVTC